MEEKTGKKCKFEMRCGECEECAARGFSRDPNQCQVALSVMAQAAEIATFGRRPSPIISSYASAD